MSFLIRSSRTLQRLSLSNPAAAYGSHASTSYLDTSIGKREVVGHGSNGMPIYHDRPDFPMPAIRYKEVTPDIQALREKEKGDWKKLSLEEKKQLYRASFCQTYAEMNAPTGEWKSILGCFLGMLGVSLWLYMGAKKFILDPELPITFTLEREQAQLQRMIDIAVDPIDGLASHWDYEKNDWKK